MIPRQDWQIGRRGIGRSIRIQIILGELGTERDNGAVRPPPRPEIQLSPTLCFQPAVRIPPALGMRRQLPICGEFERPISSQRACERLVAEITAIISALPGYV